jgi:hypothetical protein
LLRYRVQRELSQRDLAKVLGMEQPQVARLERADVNPGMDTLSASPRDWASSSPSTCVPRAPMLDWSPRRPRLTALSAMLHTERAEFLVAAT